MQKYQIISIFALLALLWGVFADAATISFDPQEKTVGLGAPFLIGLILNTDVAINTLFLSIILPRNLTPVDVSDGDSIINFWIISPHFDEATRAFSFGGIIPGGFTGHGGRLLVLTLRAEDPGEAIFKIDAEISKAYANTAKTTDVPLFAEPLAMTVSSTKEAVSNIMPDTFPPEEFIPAISKYPGLFEGKWMLLFATQDKGVGIDHYEVRESRGRIFFHATWERTESPYLLHDQDLESTISVRAVDKNGNARIEEILPIYPLPWYESHGMSYILLLGVALSFLVLARYLRTMRYGI